MQSVRLLQIIRGEMFTEFSKHKNVGKEGQHDPHPDTKAKTV